MAITWQTPAGSLGIFTERQLLEIELDATTDIGQLSYSVISGELPRGLRLDSNTIKGSPSEVIQETDKRFVVRATNGIEIKDRTFSITVDGEDKPEFITPEGFLNVGEGDAYFVLDNAPVDFQIQATDPDLVAGETLSYYIVPNSGELPPGLSLSSDGRITGFTDPVFAVERNTNETGAYDTHTFDTVSFDIAAKNTTGFDTFFYDNQTFDFSLPTQRPRRLSRFYTFAVGVTDGKNTETRIFKIYVVTTEFLKADNNILEVDTNLFQADASAERVPFWITESDLGRYRANNYVTVFLDVYDPPSLPGIISYFFVAQNPDGSLSELPPGMTLDTITGEIAGTVPYQSEVTKRYQFTLLAINFTADLADLNYTIQGDWSANTVYTVGDAVRFNGLVFIATQPSRGETPEEGEFWTLGVGTVAKTFTIDIIGNIESTIEWVTESNLGTLVANQPSQLSIEASTTAYGGTVSYEFISGVLPPGLEFFPTGIITGKIKQFADDDGPGLIRFFERDSSTEDSAGTITFNTTFDSGNTTFNREFSFTARASDFSRLSQITRTFTITAEDTGNKSFANLYVKAFMEKSKRLTWFDFITNAETFPSNKLYRFGDPNYGVQTDLRILVYAGIESKAAVNYVQAMSRSHYNKRLYFGSVQTAEAKDPTTQETVYEIVYVTVNDQYEKNGKNISDVVELRDNLNSPILISYDAITIDSDIPFVSDSDHQRVFPNSIENMRDRIQSVGDTRRDLLPLWMRSIQSDQSFEPGYTLILPLCFTLPGKSADIVANINATEFDFKLINFEADRYIIDILDGEIEDKYLAFPHRREKEP